MISLRTLREKYCEFQTHFPTATIFYAIKANSEPDVILALAELRCNFEAASVYELQLLQALKISGDRIMYGTSIRPAAHIRHFFEYGVHTYTIDSLHELEKIASFAPGSRIFVRVVVDDSGSSFRFSEKFGTDSSTAAELLRRAPTIGLMPHGLSFHVGSQQVNPNKWACGIRALTPMIRELAEEGIAVEALNIGGGFPCPYELTQSCPSLAEIAMSTVRAFSELPYASRLVIEPGRAMVAQAAVLVVSVIGRVTRNCTNWLFLDAGPYNAVFEAMPYQGSMRFPVTCLTNDNSRNEVFALAGPTGDSQDVLTRSASLPANVAVGDKLAIHNVGAYSMSLASSFNGFPKPQVFFS